MALEADPQRDVDRAPRTPPFGRIYLDVGTAEGTGTLRDVRRLGRLLVQKRFTRERRGRPRQGRSRLRYVEDQGGPHSEADWARRLPAALEFLLG